MSTKIPTYAPSSEELTTAVSSFLKESPEAADAKKARDYLLKRHPTWRVPERRVKKFVKKQAKSDQKTAASGEDAAADDQSVSSVTRRVKGMVKKIFVFKKLTGKQLSPTSAAAAAASTENAHPEAPMKEIHATSLLLSPSSDSAESAEPQVLPPAPKKAEAVVEGAVAEEEEEAKEEEKALPLDEAVVYKDDNDGKKGDCCAPCEGCTVM